MPRTSGQPGLGPPQLSQIEGLFTAEGQLFAGTGSGTGKLLSIGTTGQMLTVGGADASGLKWSNPTNDALQYLDAVGWAFDPVAATNDSVLVGAATLCLARIPLPAAVLVTNVFTYLDVLGVTLTHSFLALFKSDGTLIGQTADQSTAWEVGGATGVYNVALAGGPYTVSPLGANDFVWAAVYVGTYATSPTFPVTTTYASFHNFGAAARCRYGYIGQANTATLANIIPASITPGGPQYFLGLS